MNVCIYVCMQPLENAKFVIFWVGGCGFWGFFLFVLGVFFVCFAYLAMGECVS